MGHFLYLFIILYLEIGCKRSCGSFFVCATIDSIEVKCMLDKAGVYALLNEKHIAYEVQEHEAVYTMEDLERAGIVKRGVLLKNLFLRDSRGKQFALVSVPEEAKIDLKMLGEQIGLKKPGFASEERLMQYLVLQRGCVSPFGALNDESRTVPVVFDDSLTDDTVVGVHPNDSTASLWLQFGDLRALLEAHGSKILFVPFEKA